MPSAGREASKLRGEPHLHPLVDRLQYTVAVEGPRNRNEAPPGRPRRRCCYVGFERARLLEPRTGNRATMNGFQSLRQRLGLWLDGCRDAGERPKPASDERRGFAESGASQQRIGLKSRLRTRPAPSRAHRDEPRSMERSSAAVGSAMMICARPRRLALTAGAPRTLAPRARADARPRGSPRGGAGSRGRARRARAPEDRGPRRRAG